MSAALRAPAHGPLEIRGHPRHSTLVRITHWLSAFSFLGLLVSGVAILLAHPRLYWGETGAVGAPSLIDLPLPFVLEGQSGWGRSLHFLLSWVLVGTGGLYVAAGVATRHFKRDLLPGTGNSDEPGIYSLLQRLAYLAIIFLVSPLIIWTGLAQSPAITSVVPALVGALGGQQSARTVHFCAAGLLVLFFVVHVTMVSRAGFGDRMWAMIAGGAGGRRT
jgi:thiosulfate reductase cytochrome b subunit